MGTHVANAAAALFGRTKRAVLSVFFRDAAEWIYLREVARRAHAGLGAVQRELKRLTDAGILERRSRGRQILYRANTHSSIFAELQGLVIKTTGLVDVLCEALKPLAPSIRCAFIFGSWARGAQQAGSDIDVLIIGDIEFAEAVAVLRQAQEILGRDINPNVYSAHEYQAKLKQGHHFLTAVHQEPKLFLVGDGRELAQLADKRLARRSQTEQARDTRSVGGRRPGSRRLPGKRAQR